MKTKRARQKFNRVVKRCETLPCEKCESMQHSWPSLDCIRGRKKLYSDLDYKAGTLRDMILQAKNG